MSNPGYVYALINVSMPGLIKVGMTSRSPEERALELSSVTGVATPFLLVYKEYFSDCSEAEKYVHTMLERQGVRLSSNREFFQGEISDVIKSIASIPGKCAPGASAPADDDDDLLVPSRGDELDEFVLDNYKPKTPAQQVYEEASEYYYGFGDTIEDYDEALKLFKQAARLGSADAYHMIGQMYHQGEGVKEDYGKAIEYFKEAARRGIYCGYARMAMIFRETSHTDNENKSWKKYFEEFSKNPQDKIESDYNSILICNFLMLKTTNPTFFSQSKVKLNSLEETYIIAMKNIKEQLCENAEHSYGRSVEEFGENYLLTKQRKAVLSWLQAL